MSSVLAALSACPAMTKLPMRLTAVAGVASMHSHLDCGQSRSFGTVSSSALRSPLRGAQETGMFSMAADRRMIVCQKEANECSSVDVKPRHAITARTGFSR